MPWTLYRFILKEILKLLVVCATVLVLLVSFAAAIEPMSEGKLGAGSLVKFVFYTVPPMLGFVLPFAAAFASTLVFIRMTNDNEVLACSASGMSYVQILAPVLALGLLLSMLLIGMSNFVIPGFWQRAAKMLERDLMSLLVSQLNENRPFEMSGMVLYADRASVVDNPPVPEGQLPPQQYVGLNGVAVGRIDDTGRVTADATARTAHVALYRDNGQSVVQVHLDNTMYFDAERGELVYFESFEPPPVLLPNLARQRAKFLSWPQLRRLAREPERFESVERQKVALTVALGSENLRARMLETFQQTTGVGATPMMSFNGSYPGETFEVYAPSIREVGQRLQLESVDERQVIVRSRLPGTPGRRYEATSALVSIDAGPDASRPVAEVVLHGNVRIYDQGPDGRFARKQSHPLPRLIWAEPMLDEAVAAASVGGLTEIAAGEAYRGSQRVAAAVEALDDQVRLVRRKVRGQLNARAATAVACMLLMVLGAVLSMVVRGQLPLVVYFWSFLLAIVAIIVINTGWHMAKELKRSLIVSIGLMWFANVFLAFVVGAAYRRLARN